MMTFATRRALSALADMTIAYLIECTPWREAPTADEVRSYIRPYMLSHEEEALVLDHVVNGWPSYRAPVPVNDGSDFSLDLSLDWSNENQEYDLVLTIAQ